MLPTSGRIPPAGRRFINRFTPEARRLVVYANEIARQLGHSRANTGHLLLALLKIDSRFHTALVCELGADDDVIVNYVEALGQEPSPQQSREARQSLPLAPDFKSAMAAALLAVGPAGVVGMTDLVAASLSAPNSVAAAACAVAGVHPTAARALLASAES